MLKKENRLNKNKDFNKISQQGHPIYGGFLGVKILKNDLDYNRIGVVVGVKVSKKAVERNKIKRKIREILRLAKIKQGYDIMIIAFPGIVGKSYGEIEKAINRGLNKFLKNKN